MSLKLQDFSRVPADTAAVAWAVLRKGNADLVLRD